LGRFVAVDVEDCDLSDEAAIAHLIGEIRPQIIVHPAAYTAVDKAEKEPALAYAINAAAPRKIAQCAREIGAAMISYSTDYVFDGTKPAPYVESDAVNPLSVYGKSKWQGEEAVRTSLPDHVILRTSWVLSAHGANFLKTMLRLARERDELPVVDDQIGAPTSAELLARATATVVRLILRDGCAAHAGTYHLTAKGETSWYGYARFGISEARKLGIPIKIVDDAIRPIPASHYPTPATRPANSRLNTAKFENQFGFALPSWQDGVREVLEVLARP